jgi:hypothetical protein
MSLGASNVTTKTMVAENGRQAVVAAEELQIVIEQQTHRLKTQACEVERYFELLQTAGKSRQPDELRKNQRHIIARFGRRILEVVDGDVSLSTYRTPDIGSKVFEDSGLIVG